MENTFLEMEPNIEAQEKRVREETEKLLRMHRQRAPRRVEDMHLQTAEGVRPLSSFFEGRDEMLLISNMGKKCNYCTLWADGINGFTPHLRDRAALLIVNEDPLEVQSAMAAERGWTFPMATARGTDFFKSLGLKDDGEETQWPAVTVLMRDTSGQIYQKNKAVFGPGDLFCSFWNFIGLLPSDVEWAPKQKYT